MLELMRMWHWLLLLTDSWMVLTLWLTLRLTLRLSLPLALGLLLGLLVVHSIMVCIRSHYLLLIARGGPRFPATIVGIVILTGALLRGRDHWRWTSFGALLAYPNLALEKRIM